MEHEFKKTNTINTNGYFFVCLLKMTLCNYENCRLAFQMYFNEHWLINNNVEHQVKISKIITKYG